MTKYIVKNCPAYIINGQCAMNGEHDSPFEPVPCQDRTDCPIKQVVWLVKQYNEAYETIQRPIPTLNKQILQTLQVEEVE